MFFDFQGPAAIGLDTRGKRLYAVCLDTRNVFYPSVNDQRRFTSLPEFQDWWVSQDWGPEHLRDPAPRTRGCRVAVAADARDGLGAIRWLQSEGVPTDEFFPVYDAELDELFDVWEFPKVYKRAFALAFYALFRMQGPVVAELLWSELRQTESRLCELSARLGRLYQAMPFHDPYNPVAHCSERDHRYPF